MVKWFIHFIVGDRANVNGGTQSNPFDLELLLLKLICNNIGVFARYDVIISCTPGN